MYQQLKNHLYNQKTTEQEWQQLLTQVLKSPGGMMANMRHFIATVVQSCLDGHSGGLAVCNTKVETYGAYSVSQESVAAWTARIDKVKKNDWFTYVELTIAARALGAKLRVHNLAADHSIQACSVKRQLLNKNSEFLQSNAPTFNVLHIDGNHWMPILRY
jgi:phage I-like protein